MMIWNSEIHATPSRSFLRMGVGKVLRPVPPPPLYRWLIPDKMRAGEWWGGVVLRNTPPLPETLGVLRGGIMVASPYLL